MLAKLKLYINSKDNIINYNITTLLHGVMMSVISEEYAEYLHSGGLNPYSISLEKHNDNWCWNICTIGVTAFDNIIKPLLSDSFTEFQLMQKGGAVVTIEKKELFEENSNEIINSIVSSGCTSNIINIKLCSPTAFKSNNEYIFYPDLNLIYRSLMKKAQLVSDSVQFFDEDSLEEISNSSKIIAYNVRTSKFHLEGVKITGFVGEIAILVNGSDIIKKFVNVLFRIGEYTGIGIKSSLGMGAMKIIERREKKQDER